MRDDPVTILTMRWGTLYSSEDVNRLAAQVRLHLRRPHRFVCFTDDPTGLHPQVVALPLPDLGLPEGSTDTRWRKLALFRGDLAGAVAAHQALAAAATTPRGATLTGG